MRIILYKIFVWCQEIVNERCRPKESIHRLPPLAAPGSLRSVARLFHLEPFSMTHYPEQGLAFLEQGMTLFRTFLGILLMTSLVSCACVVVEWHQQVCFTFYCTPVTQNGWEGCTLSLVFPCTHAYIITTAYSLAC